MRNRTFHAVKYLLGAYLLLTVILPLIMLFSNIRGENVQGVFHSPQFVPMLTNSFLTTVMATVISVTISFLLAWIINRSRIRFKSVFIVLFTIPMLIPSISHGMGLVLLFGDNGIVTNLLHLNIGLYGYVGIVMGCLLYTSTASGTSSYGK